MRNPVWNTPKYRSVLQTALPDMWVLQEQQVLSDMWVLQEQPALSGTWVLQEQQVLWVLRRIRRFVPESGKDSRVHLHLRHRQLRRRRAASWWLRTDLQRFRLFPYPRMHTDWL